MSENGTIAINSREQFAQSLTTLDTLYSQVSAKASNADAVLTAVTEAASKGVVAPGSAGSSGTGNPVSPVYAASMTALGESVKGVTDQVAAAGNSVQAAIGDLRDLLANLGSIDDTGADQVKQA